eukprot:TRINITY_DN10828_c1_g1_i1.p1 TRINITY_DN10828_c1_g1~~TRINITY_DN10828_c1_g1_i1.p1  ORF type:complete len:558 (+),score=61.60 TRINITY_DN10828_c1_g1_i1:39-1712(+)
MTAHVQLRECSWVRPCTVTDAALNEVTLEPFDCLFHLRQGMAQYVTFFPGKLSTDSLKGSLVRLLDKYPFLAGRARQPIASFCFGSPFQGWKVLGRNGVAFSICSASGSARQAYDELEEDNSRNACKLVDRRSSFSIMWGRAPVMTVRVTSFEKGGSALGVAVSRGLMDDPALQQLLHEWFLGHVPQALRSEHVLQADRNTGLRKVNASNRCCMRMVELCVQFIFVASSLLYLFYFGPLYGEWAYIVGVLLFVLPVLVTLRPNPFVKMVIFAPFYCPDLSALFMRLHYSRSMGGTRLRVELDAEEVSSVVGCDLLAAKAAGHDDALDLAEAKLLARMATSVAHIMDFTAGDVQLCWHRDMRLFADGVSANYIGNASLVSIKQVTCHGKQAPALERIDSCLKEVLSNKGQLFLFEEIRKFGFQLNSFAPHGTFLDPFSDAGFGAPFITCRASLRSCVMMDLDWGAGKPIGVMSGNDGFLAMCEVQPARDGGAALYFNLTGMSHVLSLSAQGTPSGWAQKVKALNFRDDLLQPTRVPARQLSRQPSVASVRPPCVPEGV